MKRKAVYAIAALLILAVGLLYVTGYQLYRNQDTMSGSMSRAPSPEWSIVKFRSPSGETLAEFNFSTTYAVNANKSQKSVDFGFILLHAPEFNIGSLNITYSIGPWPKEVGVTGFNYDTGSVTPNDRIANYTGDPTHVSGAVITVFSFPPSNPTPEYGVGLAYTNAELPSDIGSTSVTVQMVLTTGSGTPFVGDAYAGQLSFNLVYTG